MNGARVPGARDPAAEVNVPHRLATALQAHREAMAAGDLPAMLAGHERIQALLSDAHWRDAAHDGMAAVDLRAALQATAVGAALALRGEAHARRALASLGMSADVYTAAGALARGAGVVRARSA